MAIPGRQVNGARNIPRIHAPFSPASMSGSWPRVRWICSCRVRHQPRASTHRKSESRSERYRAHIAEEAWPILPSDTSGPRGSCSLHRACWAALSPYRTSPDPIRELRCSILKARCVSERGDPKSCGLTDEDAPAREYQQEWVQVVWVRALQVIQSDRTTACRFWEDL
jgi:hypothetical protein